MHQQGIKRKEEKDKKSKEEKAKKAKEAQEAEKDQEDELWEWEDDEENGEYGEEWEEGEWEDGDDGWIAEEFPWAISLVDRRLGIEMDWILQCVPNMFCWVWQACVFDKTRLGLHSTSNVQDVRVGPPKKQLHISNM